MAWHITDSVDEFLAGAGDFLRARPVENTVLLTVTDTLRQRGSQVYGDGPPVFGWHGDGAFVRTPPRGALLSEMPPAAAAELAVSLAGTDLPGVSAPGAVTEAFAAEWQRLTGVTGEVVGRQRLYRLVSLTPPDPAASGAGRIAGAGDRDLLIGWMTAFQRELGEEPQATAEFVDDKLAYGGMLLWEDAGQPVSMSGISRPAAGMVRVMAVYTPREHRARGYAGAATTAVTRAALDAGANDVVLFADQSNPTSNALYQRLGYTPIEDRQTVEFPS
ncbi:GNAT family N-acetyltransferase [Actinoplanes sp. ATCC 53533]|uniref:GNAT family N-acetyltransferase n=1 Tax=Actinoplanes sp. ATCC 53533 TaxID=1288362 RepID=UPI000F76EF67|nr:GNAT family N-acetyltransferase [Actinoplanes sp. ATCC 53533]RSM49760.1 GNAT family N-acetyltransferase [Actinoplanes sp. ATCC 53533]